MRALAVEPVGRRGDLLHPRGRQEEERGRLEQAVVPEREVRFLQPLLSLSGRVQGEDTGSWRRIIRWLISARSRRRHWRHGTCPWKRSVIAGAQGAPQLCAWLWATEGRSQRGEKAVQVSRSRRCHPGGGKKDAVGRAGAELGRSLQP